MIRAYITAINGVNVRRAASVDSTKLYAIAYKSAVEVDKVVSGQWSKLTNFPDARYIFGSYLSTTPPEEIFHLPFSASRYHLHASAGGWPPEQRGIDIVSANRIEAVFICTYEPNQASLNIERFRQAGVQHFVIRATAPINLTNSPQIWANIAIDRLRPFIGALGAKVMVQLHNEPNLYDEGLGVGWRSPSDFNLWFLTVSSIIKRVFPNIKIGFSPMSPGSDVPGIRISETKFTAACGAAIRASDWIAVHNYYGQQDAGDLAVPATKWRQFAQGKPIVCTEGGPSADRIATTAGLARMYRAFAMANVPVFAWLLSAAGNSHFEGQSWERQNIIIPTFAKR